MCCGSGKYFLKFAYDPGLFSVSLTLQSMAFFNIFVNLQIPHNSWAYSHSVTVPVLHLPSASNQPSYVVYLKLSVCLCVCAYAWIQCLDSTVCVKLAVIR